MLRPALLVAAVLLLLPAAARACAAALVFAMDVSGSVDAGEYRLQTDGLADALDDPEIAATLVEGEVALAVTQWSGLGLQHLALPWRRITTTGEAAAFAEAVRRMPRAFTGSDTAVGEGLAFALTLFADVPDCRRRIVDISGDGAENVGFTVTRVRREAMAMRVEVNGLAIESIGLSITQFYRNWVVTPGGFVVTARGHIDFARAMRIKVLRELARPLG